MTAFALCGALAMGCDDGDTAAADAGGAGGGGGGACPAGTTEVDTDLCSLPAGTYTNNLTLAAGPAYLLEGPVFIGDGASATTLTIEAGVTIYGKKDAASPGTLIIAQGAKIQANGTREAPIHFTSDQLEGQQAPGDWGGIILNGHAPINVCGTNDGSCTAQGEGATGTYGGDDPDDNSGTLRYVIVSYAGTLFSEENELNGIAFQGVGRGTTVDYIQVHRNKDDGVEFFGGTVDVKHVVLTDEGDDSLDWTDGWQGRAQFVLIRQADDDGDNGIEADNRKGNNDYEPRSNPTLSNVTLLGSANADLGLLLREGTGAHLSNFIVTGFGEACLALDHSATFVGACDADAPRITIENMAIQCDEAFGAPDEENTPEPPPCSTQDVFARGGGNAAVDPQLNGYLPAEGSPMLGVGRAPADPWFDQVDFVGAFGTEDWAAGWTVGL
ncbi:MAG: hypothetical protein KC620_12890 [Myxococcales bacterium]|nr:hypothetical protein [Myxococcales bacterium]